MKMARSSLVQLKDKNLFESAYGPGIEDKNGFLIVSRVDKATNPSERYLVWGYPSLQIVEAFKGTIQVARYNQRDHRNYPIRRKVAKIVHNL